MLLQQYKDIYEQIDICTPNHNENDNLLPDAFYRSDSSRLPAKWELGYCSVHRHNRATSADILLQFPRTWLDKSKQ